jgi:hypothetical protein
MQRQRRSNVLVLTAVLTSAGFGVFTTVLRAQGQRDACDWACLNGHMNEMESVWTVLPAGVKPAW